MDNLNLASQVKVHNLNNLNQHSQASLVKMDNLNQDSQANQALDNQDFQVNLELEVVTEMVAE